MEKDEDYAVRAAREWATMTNECVDLDELAAIIRKHVDTDLRCKDSDPYCDCSRLHDYYSG